MIDILDVRLGMKFFQIVKKFVDREAGEYRHRNFGQFSVVLYES